MKSTQLIDGPFFEDLEIGFTATDAPALTLTEGLAAQHMAILGDRFRLALDHELSRRVTGGVMAHPALVWDVANGQSTLLTRRVVANLFYRGLMFQRFPMLGDTLHTTTEVIGLRQNRVRPGRAPTGVAVLRVHTVDQQGRDVLDYRRCPMLPLRDPDRQTAHQAELAEIPADLDPIALRRAIAGWRFDAFRQASRGPHFADFAAGMTWEIAGGDVVSSAPELARLTLNIAIAHHDAASSAAGRLVYGGHTIGLAAAQVARAIPNLATIIAWHGCDHLGPVREGDTLRSTLELEKLEPLNDGGGLLHLHSRVRADGDGTPRDVLDWRLVGVMA